MLNPRVGLRRADEFVRHKMLDALGDLALAGAPILGHYRGVRAGHGATNRCSGRLFATPDAWEWSRSMPRAAAQLPGCRHRHGGPAPALVEARHHRRDAQPRTHRRGLRFSFQPPRNLC